MYEYSGVVKRVVDGDTLDIIVDLGFKIQKEIRIRLLGIDTPEIYHPSCKAEYRHGKEAQQFVEDKMMGKTIILATHKDKTGKYGRYLADIVYDTENVATFLTEELKDAGFEKRLDYLE